MYKTSLNYYYHILEPVEKRAYENLFVAYKKMKRETLLKGIYDSKHALRIIKYVYNDNPEFFYVEPTRINYYIGIQGITVTHTYRYEKTKKEEYDRKIRVATDAFMKKWIRPNMNLYEKLQAINDFLATTVTYDPIVRNALREKRESVRGACEDYSIVGPLVNRVGVCHGIAMAAKYLCDLLGIQCMVISGTVKNEGRHAWNIVYTGINEGKRFYHWDPTFNLTKNPRSNARFQYFMVGDSVMEKEREWNKNECPACIWTTWDPGRKHLFRPIVCSGRRE